MGSVDTWLGETSFRTCLGRDEAARMWEQVSGETGDPRCDGYGWGYMTTGNGHGRIYLEEGDLTAHGGHPERSIIEFISRTIMAGEKIEIKILTEAGDIYGYVVGHETWEECEWMLVTPAEAEMVRRSRDVSPVLGPV